MEIPILFPLSTRGRRRRGAIILESHARRVYSCVVTPQLRAARELADKMKRRNVGADGFFSCRDVYLKGWSGLDTPEAVKLAAEVLQDAEMGPESIRRTRIIWRATIQPLRR